jgi:hypothetical protein
MFSWFEKKRVAPMNVVGGDTVRVTITGRDGRGETVNHTIDKVATYNTIAVGEIENELGFKDGLVGVIGNE